MNGTEFLILSLIGAIPASAAAVVSIINASRQTKVAKVVEATHLAVNSQATELAKANKDAADKLAGENLIAAGKLADENARLIAQLNATIERLQTNRPAPS